MIPEQYRQHLAEVDPSLACSAGAAVQRIQGQPVQQPSAQSPWNFQGGQYNNIIMHNAAAAAPTRRNSCGQDMSGQSSPTEYRNTFSQLVTAPEGQAGTSQLASSADISPPYYSTYAQPVVPQRQQTHQLWAVPQPWTHESSAHTGISFNTPMQCHGLSEPFRSSQPVMNPMALASNGLMSTSPVQQVAMGGHEGSEVWPSSLHKTPGDGRKCRKVYGVDNKSSWCNQCRWKKACVRFQN